MVLVTGATGFVGTALCDRLRDDGWRVRRALRSPANASADDVIVGEIHAGTDWTPALQGIEHVIHLAARTHVLHDTAADPLAAYRRINVDGTRGLAEAAVRAGVRRFVFMSSIKVNGEATGAAPFRESDTPRPEDAYGTTKLGAEELLRAISARTSMEAVILRPPLAYGPGVKGNFLRLLRLVQRGVPLPLAAVDNRRSLVYVGNLVDAVCASLEHDAAAGETFLVADGVDLSTPALVREMAHALGTRARLVPFPLRLLSLAAALTGKGDELKRLTGSLQVDTTLIRSRLGWQPPYTARAGIAATARWYHPQLVQAPF
jgi:nucleoside-diphosphate-sugar epimerase